MSTLIELKSVARHYTGSSGTVRAVDNVSLSFKEGDFSVLAGSSGSGKTTLLNLIGGIDRPDIGEVLISGISTQGKSESELADLRLNKIGFIFQSYNLLPVLTVYENVQFILQIRGIADRLHNELILPVLKRLGLIDLKERFPSQLSGGQQQRVAIARAIVLKPSIVLADEPTANLDSDTADSLLDLMQSLNHEDRVTFLFSSHDPEVIRRARTVIRLRDGKVIEIENR
ncbi:MAG: ABC transporter ATP-binding protein [Candidatus Cloacimonetes bacterium]|nr:ABC transporter ATP-binding protein [Candidatus Cloacimonadota bacterium]